MALHSGIYFMQFTTLNVAFISSSTTLLTVLVSNNFVELKGSIFKKCGPENLFQLCGGDIVRPPSNSPSISPDVSCRFEAQAARLLSVPISIHSCDFPVCRWSALMASYSSALPLFSTCKTSNGLLHPRGCGAGSSSVHSFSSASLLLIGPSTRSSPNLMTYSRSFTRNFRMQCTRQNSKFLQPVLCSCLLRYKDLTINPTASSSGVQVDRMQVVSRRIGFTPLPLACVFVRLVYTAFPFFSWINLPTVDPMQPLLIVVVAALVFLTFTLMKLLVCIILLGRACINRMALPPQGEEEDNELERFNFARHIVF
jgi:hypothetical protein